MHAAVFWLPSEKMDMVFEVQIRNKTVSIKITIMAPEKV